MNYFAPQTDNPWEWGWNALAAIGTIGATVVAVAGPSVAAWLRRRKERLGEEKRLAILGYWLAPVLAQVELEALAIERTIRTTHMIDKLGNVFAEPYDAGALTFASLGRLSYTREEIYGLDAPTAIDLSSLQSRIAFFNAMSREAVAGPLAGGMSRADKAAAMMGAQLRDLELILGIVRGVAEGLVRRVPGLSAQLHDTVLAEQPSARPPFR